MSEFSEGNVLKISWEDWRSIVGPSSGREKLSFKEWAGVNKVKRIRERSPGRRIQGKKL